MIVICLNIQSRIPVNSVIALWLLNLNEEFLWLLFTRFFFSIASALAVLRSRQTWTSSASHFPQASPQLLPNHRSLKNSHDCYDLVVECERKIPVIGISTIRPLHLNEEFQWMLFGCWTWMKNVYSKTAQCSNKLLILWLSRKLSQCLFSALSQFRFHNHKPQVTSKKILNK